MSYIGNAPFSTAFVTDYFTGDGTTTAFTLSVAPAGSSSVLAQLGAAIQSPADYSVIGSTITFSAAPPSGVPIIVRALGIPASGVTTTAYRTVTEITATAGQTVFTPASYTPNFIDVYQNGVHLGAADYTATNGTTVTLAVGATSGDLLTFVSFSVSSVLNAIPAQAGAIVASYLAGGAASQAFLDAATGTGTGALKLPVGTTAQRPTGQAGLIRQNSTTGNPEWFDTTTGTWLQFSQPAGYLVNYLVVAGGGGGGPSTSNVNSAGGGGAGGVLASSISLSSGTAYTITIGAGGPSSAAGNNSSLSTVATSIGGGVASISSVGGSGGSGAGGGTNGATSYLGGSGTAGQGNNGGNGATDNSTYRHSGGGGGAGAVGVNATSSGSGAGGIGVSSSISGASVYYGGGGGGAGTFNNGAGGLGGGGAGTTFGAGVNGTSNTGGGGGGSHNSGGIGGSGGSGIVIISYLGSQRGTGGTVTSSGGYTIHTFTSSGTFTA